MSLQHPEVSQQSGHVDPVLMSHSPGPEPVNQSTSNSAMSKQSSISVGVRDQNVDMNQNMVADKLLPLDSVLHIDAEMVSVEEVTNQVDRTCGDQGDEINCKECESLNLKLMVSQIHLLK